MENGTQMTLELFPQEISQEQTSGALDSLAKTSALPEKESDFGAIVQACSSELCTWLAKSQKKKDPLTSSLRMLKICLLLMEDGISPEFSLRWTGLATMSNGSFSTPKISESPKTESECLLSDILDPDPPQRYFLSKEQTERIKFTK